MHARFITLNIPKVILGEAKQVAVSLDYQDEAFRATLKERGYRWDRALAYWSLNTSNVAAETQWLLSNGCQLWMAIAEARQAAEALNLTGVKVAVPRITAERCSESTPIPGTKWHQVTL